MKKVALTLAVALAGIPAIAQSPANPLSTAEKNVYLSVKANIMGAAEEMPEADYSFKPTADVRTFGQLVGHVADGQYEFCGPVVGDHTESPNVEKTKTSKTELMEALRTAFAYCDKAFSGLTDTNAAEIVPFFNRKMPKLTMLSFNTAHTDEHYGNMVTYLRMKNLVPPSSQKH